jgi:DNA repair protein NreA
MEAQISSKDLVSKRKKEFYSKIISELDFDKYSEGKQIFGKTNNLLLVNSPNSFKLGPIFGNFSPKDSYYSDYETIVKKLALSINPFNFQTEINLNKSKPRFIESMQEVAKSSKPVDLDVSLKDKPNFNLEEDQVLNPIGFKARLDSLDITSNPKIPWQVDDVTEDKLKSVEMISALDDYGFDSYYLTNIFSAGTTGIDKRLVTTRQSITAIDDILAKKIIESIKEFDCFDRYLVFENEFLHNKFAVILMPGSWEYEQFELWPRTAEDTSALNWNKPGCGYNHEHESFKGRTKYAELQGGGYYAARLPVCEYLMEKKKQAKVLIVREIYNDYSIPVGVWQVRENVRHAFNNDPKEFEDTKQIKEYLKKELKYDLNEYLHESKIFGQNRIMNYFN